MLYARADASCGCGSKHGNPPRMMPDNGMLEGALGRTGGAVVGAGVGAGVGAVVVARVGLKTNCSSVLPFWRA